MSGRGKMRVKRTGSEDGAFLGRWPLQMLHTNCDSDLFQKRKIRTYSTSTYRVQYPGRVPYYYVLELIPSHSDNQ